jgi:hypothetical protein
MNRPMMPDERLFNATSMIGSDALLSSNTTEKEAISGSPGSTRTAALLRGLAPLAVKVVAGTWAPLRKRHASWASRRSE